mmetsp:Transcript_12146/g.24201  ORF Transcript_12146/g.24201 Transcript_12146/m.24201 type:complete len:142 (-) Transcript_12146:212-637(-)
MQTIQLSEDKREAYTVLQTKYNAQRTQFNGVVQQLRVLDRDQKRNQLTLSELEALPDGTNTYKAIGKMFMQEPCQKIVEELAASVEKASDELVKLTEQHSALEKSLSETQDGIKELVTAAQAPTELGTVAEAPTEEPEEVD